MRLLVHFSRILSASMTNAFVSFLSCLVRLQNPIALQLCSCVTLTVIFLAQSPKSPACHRLVIHSSRDKIKWTFLMCVGNNVKVTGFVNLDHVSRWRHSRWTCPKSHTSFAPRRQILTKKKDSVHFAPEMINHWRDMLLTTIISTPAQNSLTHVLSLVYTSRATYDAHW